MKKDVERRRQQSARRRAEEPPSEAARARFEDGIEPLKRRGRFIEADLLDREECLRAFGEDVREVGSTLRRYQADTDEDAALYKHRRKAAITTNNNPGGDDYHG